MAEDNTTSTVLATIGTVIWCIQLSPQIYFLYKKKNAEGFPPIFMLLWCISGVFMAVYFIISDSYIPLQIQPHLFTLLCSIAWIQSMYYPPQSYNIRKIILIAGSFYVFWIALEVAACIPLRPVYADGKKWPDLIFGIIATVFLSIGLLPPYWELLHRRGRVVGINFVFLAMDSSGAVFSMAAMCVGTFDAMGMVMYAIIIAMELGLFLSQGIWMLRFGKEQKLLEREEINNSSNENDELCIEKESSEFYESKHITIDDSTDNK